MDEIDRDRRIVATVACPHCGAPIGERCLLRPGDPASPARGMPHAERLAAWREITLPPREGRAQLDNRDRKVVAAAACPFCEAAPGRRCTRYPGSPIELDRPHAERREAWQQSRGTPPPEHPPTYCSCGHGRGAHNSHGCEKCSCTVPKRAITAG